MKFIATTLLSLSACTLFAAEPITPLDRAYQAARNDESKVGEFYNLFLRSTIYIPTYDLPGRDETRKPGTEDTFSPVIIEDAGRKTLILFDSLPRLQRYATSELGYVTMSGLGVLKTMSDDLYWVLNHTTEHFKGFSPQEIAYIKGQVEASQPDGSDKALQVSVGAPHEMPAALITTLMQTLEKNEKVKEARLGQVNPVGSDEAPHLALVLKTDGMSEEEKKALLQEIASACRDQMAADDTLEVLMDEPDGVAAAIRAKVAPFLTKP